MDIDEDKNIAKGTTDLGVEFFHQRNCVKVTSKFNFKSLPNFSFKILIKLDFKSLP